MLDLNHMEQYRENNRLEAKLATGGLPHSLWETYSAFANSYGGVILLGVEELPDHSLRVQGLLEPHEMADELWSMLSDPKVVSANILQREDVQVLNAGDDQIVAIFVPRAPARLRPVYIGQDPYGGTYFRMGEGDCRAQRHEVLAMLQDQENIRKKET